MNSSPVPRSSPSRRKSVNWVACAGDGRLDPARELGLDRSGQGESGQVIIPGGGDLGAGLQSGHLAVAGVEQAGLAEQLSDSSIEREVQGIVGGVAGRDVGRQEQSRGLGGGGPELELGQVGSMILTVPELHQPVVVGGVIARAGGGVEPDPLHREGGDVAVGAPEIGLEHVPRREIAESAEDQGQAVVVERDGPDGLSEERLEGPPEALDPRLDVRLAVVGLGEDGDDPDGDQPTVGEPLMERMRGEMAVEDLGQPKLAQEPQEHRHVIDPLVSQFQGGIIDPLVSQFQGGIHVAAPTKCSGRPSLYRGGPGGGKIQEAGHEHGKYRKVR